MQHSSMLWLKILQLGVVYLIRSTQNRQLDCCQTADGASAWLVSTRIDVSQPTVLKTCKRHICKGCSTWFSSAE